MEEIGTCWDHSKCLGVAIARGLWSGLDGVENVSILAPSHEGFACHRHWGTPEGFWGGSNLTCVLGESLVAEEGRVWSPPSGYFWDTHYISTEVWNRRPTQPQPLPRPFDHSWSKFVDSWNLHSGSLVTITFSLFQSHLHIVVFTHAFWGDEISPVGSWYRVNTWVLTLNPHMESKKSVHFDCLLLIFFSD